jgi:hypothetical protein
LPGDSSWIRRGGGCATEERTKDRFDDFGPTPRMMVTLTLVSTGRSTAFAGLVGVRRFALFL